MASSMVRPVPTTSTAASGATRAKASARHGSATRPGCTSAASDTGQGATGAGWPVHSATASASNPPPPSNATRQPGPQGVTADARARWWRSVARGAASATARASASAA